ncbi:MAG: tetratricopeptide repeat protein [Pseudomonadota bacterium]
MLKIIAQALKVTTLSTSIIVFGAFGFANADLSKTVSQSGLSGSFLASRVAITDQDDNAAVRFLERAATFDPDNVRLKQDLLSALVSNGRIEEAGKVAREIEASGTNRNLIGFVKATQELKKRSWNKVAAALKDVAGADLDKTLREITLAWALSGERKADEALAKLDDLEGPEWIKVMRDYHSGLIADVAGKSDLAAEKFQAVIDNRAVISVLTETYIRTIEAMVRSRSKVGAREEALEALDFGQTLLPDHGPFVLLREALGNEQTLTPLLTSPQDGVAELFYNISTALRRDGSGNFAKSYLQMANHLSPETDVITVALAELYLRQSDFERSNDFYDSIPEDSAFYRIGQLERASNLSRLERKEEAIESLKVLIEQEPSDLAGYMVLGDIYNREKRYRDAANTFDQAVSIIGLPENHHWNLFFRRGIAYERLKEWPTAEPNFKKSLELSEDQPEVLNYLGYSWIDQGINLDEGMQMIRKAVELRPRSGFIVDSLGWAHYRLGEFEDAVIHLERAVQLMPQDPTINDHLGDAYWKVGRKLEATFQWKIALAAKTPPDQPELIEKKLVEGLVEEEKDEAKAE